MALTRFAPHARASRVAALVGAGLLLSCGKGAPREPGGTAAEGGASAPVSAPPSGPSPSTSSVPLAADEPAGEAALAASPSDGCAALPRQTCMESPGCTLVHEAQPLRRELYRCRPAEPPCETLVRQSAFSGEARDAARRQCERHSECAFQDADCYCPCRGAGQTSVPDGPEARSCNCVCGGGAPARCAFRP